VCDATWLAGCARSDRDPAHCAFLLWTLKDNHSFSEDTNTSLSPLQNIIVELSNFRQRERLPWDFFFSSLSQTSDSR